MALLAAAVAALTDFISRQLLLGVVSLLVLSSSLQLLFRVVADQRWRRSSARDDSMFPRGPPAWPILGHLPLLQSGCPHRTLSALSGALGYGPILGLRLGSCPAVIVSSAALAKEILLTHDKDFASRPRYLFTDSLHYGYETDLLFSKYGPNWASLRKLFTLELFTSKRLQDLSCVRLEEIGRLVQSLLEASCNGTKAVEVGNHVANMSSDIVSRLLRSERMSDGARAVAGSAPETYSLHHLVKELEQTAKPTLGDFIPWLKWLDVWQKRRMEELHNRLDKVIDAMLVERREAIRSNTSDLPHDFLQALLLSRSEINDSAAACCSPAHNPRISVDSEIKNSILDLMSAGIHTTSTTVEWAMAELLRNPRCLHKLREEIDALMSSRRDELQLVDGEISTVELGRGGIDIKRLVRDEDLPKLPYLEKVVKEVLRLHPAAPLLLPRISTKECKVLGKYLLPEGTHTFVNVWAIGRDPEVWENAQEFWPERFDEGRRARQLDVRGQDYELLPFGSGRRMCPAWRLGLAVVQATVANLVLAFGWELPPGQTPQSVDMTEKRGISSARASPLQAILKPRRPSFLLEDTGCSS